MRKPSSNHGVDELVCDEHGDDLPDPPAIGPWSRDDVPDLLQEEPELYLFSRYVLAIAVEGEYYRPPCQHCVHLPIPGQTESSSKKPPRYNRRRRWN